MRPVVGLAIILGAVGCGNSGASKMDNGEILFSEESLSAPICVTIQRGVLGNVMDAQIASDKPTTNYGSKSAANINGGAVVRQFLLRFDLGAIPSGAIVQSANLTVTGYQSTLGASATLRAHKVLVPWSENDITWAGFQGSFSPMVEASAISNRNVSVPMTFDVKSLVQGWVSGAFPNDGVLLEQSESTITGLGTSESANITSRPKLDICYLPDMGQSSMAMVSAGGLSKSGRYTMVHAFGQSTQNQGKSTSQHYGLHGGLIGQNGSVQ